MPGAAATAAAEGRLTADSFFAAGALAGGVEPLAPAPGLMAYQAWKDTKLPSGIQVLRQASQAASVEGSLGGGGLTIIRRLADSFGEQVKAIAPYVVSPSRLLRVVQGLGAAAGVVGGGFHAEEGADMLHNADPRDN